MKNDQIWKDTLGQVAKWTTVTGAVIIGASSVGTLLQKPFTAKGAVMPIITMLVAVSAISWAMTQPVGFIPRTTIASNPDELIEDSDELIEDSDEPTE